MDCGRVSFCLLGDPDYFSITARPWLPHSSQSFTINCGLFVAILDENVGIYKFFHNFNKQQRRLQKFSQLELECSFSGWNSRNIWMLLSQKYNFGLEIMINFYPAYSVHNWANSLLTFDTFHIFHCLVSPSRWMKRLSKKRVLSNFKSPSPVWRSAIFIPRIDWSSITPPPCLRVQVIMDHLQIDRSGQPGNVDQL